MAQMKVNFSYIFLIFSAVLMLDSGQAYAQEEVDPTTNELRDVNQNSEPSLNEDKSLILERDHAAVKARDSIHSRPSLPTSAKIKAAEQAKPSANKEDDALSFNFLYYIIQKFKISDLVDE